MKTQKGELERLYAQGSPPPPGDMGGRDTVQKQQDTARAMVKPKIMLACESVTRKKASIMATSAVAWKAPSYRNLGANTHHTMRWRLCKAAAAMVTSNCTQGVKDGK